MRNGTQRDYLKSPWRFWAHVSRTDGCWEWQGAQSSSGYGQVRHVGATTYVHRLAWEMSSGPIPDGLFVCHTCDNRMCVRPDHLFLGTHTENMRDMQSKGRGFSPARGAAHCKAGHEYTEENTNVLPSGVRQCRACRREWVRAWRARKAA